MSESGKITLSQASRYFGQTMDIIREGRHVELTEHGHPIAAIIPINDYRAFMAANAKIPGQQNGCWMEPTGEQIAAWARDKVE